LIDRCLKGDQRAFHELYKAYSSWLFAICVRYSTTRDDAQDALQESFVDIFKNLAQYSRESDFKAWIKRIAVHRSLSQHRKKNAKIYTQMKDDLTENCSLHNDLLEALAADEIMFYIKKLSPGRQQIFTAYFIEGYSHKEIANLLGISEGTSKSQLHDAKRELKIALEKEFSRAKNIGHG
jgi:RNA polymerase sigma-70 factor (ECF subfamily)